MILAFNRNTIQRPRDDMVFNDFIGRLSQHDTPSFFLKHIRPAVFIGGLRTDIGDMVERTVASVGAQLDLEFTLAHRLPMTFSVGYAAGYEHGEYQSEEWMISLKIL